MGMRTKVRMVSCVTMPGRRDTCLNKTGTREGLGGTQHDHGSEAAGTAGRTVVKGVGGVRGKADITFR